MNEKQSKIWENLNAYFDGELDHSQRHEMEQLLFEDPSYTEALTQWREIRQQFQALPTSKEKPQLTQSIMAKVEQELNSGNLPWKPTENLLGQDPLFQASTASNASPESEETNSPDKNAQPPKVIRKSELREWNPDQRRRSLRLQAIGVTSVLAMMVFVVVYSNIPNIDFGGLTAFSSVPMGAEAESSKAELTGDKFSGNSKSADDRVLDLKSDSIASTDRNSSKKEKAFTDSSMKKAAASALAESSQPRKNFKVRRNGLRGIQSKSAGGFEKGSLKGTNRNRQHVQSDIVQQSIADSDASSRKQSMFSQNSQDDIGQPESFHAGNKSAAKIEKGAVAKSAMNRPKSTQNFQARSQKSYKGIGQQNLENLANRKTESKAIEPFNANAITRNALNEKSDAGIFVKPNRLNMANFAYTKIQVPQSESFYKKVEANFVQNGWTKDQVRDNVRLAVMSNSNRTDDRSIFLLGNIKSVLDVMEFLNQNADQVDSFTLSELDPFWFQNPSMQSMIQAGKNNIFHIGNNNDMLVKSNMQVQQWSAISGAVDDIRKGNAANPNLANSGKVNRKVLLDNALDQRGKIAISNQVISYSQNLLPDAPLTSYQMNQRIDQVRMQRTLQQNLYGGLSADTNQKDVSPAVPKKSEINGVQSVEGKKGMSLEKNQNSKPGNNIALQGTRSQTKAQNGIGGAKQSLLPPSQAANAFGGGMHSPELLNNLKPLSKKQLAKFKQELLKRNFRPSKSDLDSMMWVLIEFVPKK